jgi:hypothetical protein
MDVDRGGKRPPLKCFNCGKLGHIARNCANSRVIREFEKEVEKEEEDFAEESQ